jgi:putative acyl-CoA dehydrogenase
MRTHDGVRQAPPLVEDDVFATDRALVAAEQEGAGWASEWLSALGQSAGGEALAWGQQANRYPPELETFDRYGNRRCRDRTAFVRPMRGREIARL